MSRDVKFHVSTGPNGEYLYQWSEYLPLAYQSLDANGRFLYANQAWLDLLGYDREQVTGQWFGDFVSPEYRDVFDEGFPRFKEECKVHGVEFDMVRKDGAIIPVAFDGRVELDEDGAFQRTHCILHDMTTRVEAEFALRADRNRLEQLVRERSAELARERDLLTAWMDHMPSVAFIKDLDGRFTFVNRAFENLFDLEPGEIIGKTAYDLYPTSRETAEQMRATDRKLLEAGSSVTVDETVVVHGEDRYEVAVKFPLRDAGGEITFLAGNATDITERKQAEEALAHERDLLDALLDNIPDLVYFKDRENRFVRSSLSMLEFIGIEHPADVIGKTDFDFFNPDRAAAANADEQRVVETGEPLVGKLEYIRRWDGERRWVTATKVPLYDREGRIAGTVGISRDVDEQVRLQAERDEQHRMLRAVLDAVPEFVVFKDKKSAFQLCNQPLLDFLGLSMEEAVGKTDFDFYSAEDAQRYRDEERRAMESGGIVVSERPVPGPLRTYWEEAVKVPVRDENGEIIGVLSIGRDITERRQMEEQLRLTQFSRDAASISIFGISPEGRFFYVNDAACRTLGYSRDALLEMNVWDVDPEPEYAAEMRPAQWERIKQSQPLCFETRHRRRDGRTFPVDVTAQYLEYGGREYEFAFATDITERKEAEEALRDSERQYRLLAENVRDVIWTVDEDLRFTYISPSIRRLRGLDPEEAMQETIERTMTPESYQKVVEARVNMEEAYARGETDLAGYVEVQQGRKDGSLVWVGIMFQPLFDEKGEMFGILGVSRDISDRRRLEEQLRQSQKMEVVGRLAGGIAHDFNNLLTTILGYGSFVKMSIPPDDPALEDIGQVIKAGERAALLTKQLLAFSRQQMIVLRLLDLNELILDLSKMLRRLIAEDIELAILPAEGLGQVRADRGQIEQVLVNLAVNARDAMPKGGTLTLKTAHVALDEDAVRDRVGLEPGDYVQLTASDTGVGMDEEVRTHVFEPFFTTKEMGKGTGLGLATAYGIVKQHGGDIWVHSEPGKGTTFEVYLPRVEDESGTGSPAGSASLEEDLSLGSETILLAEDEPSVRNATGRMLKSLGYTVLEAANGEEALRLVGKYEGEIDLLVTDVVMPQMGGRELADRLVSEHPDCRVLFVSGYTDDLTTHHGVLEEGVAMLNKPFTLRILARKVRRVLDERS